MSKVSIKDIEEDIKSKVYTPESFHLELVEIVESKKAESMIEAIGVFCADHDLDGDDLVHLVDETLKERLRVEAEGARIIRSKKKPTLPL